MSMKNKNSKWFVLIMSVVVIVIIIIGLWLTWKIIEDGMNKEATQLEIEIVNDEN